jgi:hypothetical protein
MDSAYPMLKIVGNELNWQSKLRLAGEYALLKTEMVLS